MSTWQIFSLLQYNMMITLHVLPRAYMHVRWMVLILVYDEMCGDVFCDVVKQLRGQSVMHRPQMTLSTDDADDDADEGLDETVIGKYSGALANMVWGGTQVSTSVSSL